MHSARLSRLPVAMRLRTGGLSSSPCTLPVTIPRPFSPGARVDIPAPPGRQDLRRQPGLPFLARPKCVQCSHSNFYATNRRLPPRRCRHHCAGLDLFPRHPAPRSDVSADGQGHRLPNGIVLLFSDCRLGRPEQRGGDEKMPQVLAVTHTLPPGCPIPDNAFPRVPALLPSVASPFLCTAASCAARSLMAPTCASASSPRAGTPRSSVGRDACQRPA